MIDNLSVTQLPPAASTQSLDTYGSKWGSMIKIVRFTLVVLLLVQFPAIDVTAAPDPPFEAYLLRAETIFIGRIADRNNKEVAFEVTELLRGRSKAAINIRRYAIDNEGFVSKGSQIWLVISQGDNHFGKPKQVMSLGPQLDGQCCYRGWIAFPIREDSEGAYVDHVFTFVDWKPGETLAKMTLHKAKMLIQQFSYKPDTRQAVVANGGEIVQAIGSDAPEVTARFLDPAGNIFGLYQEPNQAAPAPEQ